LGDRAIVAVADETSGRGKDFEAAKEVPGYQFHEAQLGLAPDKQIELADVMESEQGGEGRVAIAQKFISLQGKSGLVSPPPGSW
jgi:hypothetical protein